MKCRKCDADISITANFCSNCGEPTAIPCAGCGQLNAPSANFCGPCGRPIDKRLQRQAVAVPADGSKAERRQLTILFCDMVGSVARSTQRDPEDHRTVMRDYLRRCEEVIVLSGGFVAKYLGDGVLAYFGYPQADEAGAESAVRAGLRLVEDVGLIETGDVQLQVRVGIATGLVVVGDTLGFGAAREHSAFGQTPNLAARLQTLAEPNTVVIAASTKRLTGGLFTYETLELSAVKGFAGTVPAWKVLGPADTISRFEARAGGGLTPLINRTEELDVIDDAWRRVTLAAEGQVVLFCGDPGIGKSRIIRAFRQRVGDAPYTTLDLACAPHQEDSALYPLIRQLRSAAGFSQHDTDAEKIAKLEALLAESSTDLAGDMALLAELLSLPAADQYPPPVLSPQRRKQMLIEVLVSQLVNLAGQQPVLLVWEDLHWCDPTSLELIERVAERISRLRVLLVLTYRPTFVPPPWTGGAHVASRTLSRLSRQQVSALSEGVTGGKLPTEVLQQIVTKSDGVPLFIEELTKTVLESGLLAEQGGHYVLTGALPSLAVPGTLQDTLVARLDRLGPVRELLHIGAAIGREFQHDVLAAIALADGPELEDSMEQLISSGLVFRSGRTPDVVYTFKHALIRDAAYELMLRSKRQDLHGRIAQTLAHQFGDRVATQPDVLAYHYTEAGQPQQAVPYWQQAGMRAAATAAYVEAVGHFRAALRLLEGVGTPEEQANLELGLQVQLGLSLAATRGYAAPEVQQAYDRALALCDRLGDTSDIFPVLRGLCTFYIVRADLLTARDLAKRCTQIAEQTQRPEHLIEGYTALGYTLAYMGELAEGRRLLEAAVSLYHAHDGHLLSYPTSQDPAVACLSLLAQVRWSMGDLSAGASGSEAAVAAARRLDRPFDIAYAHCFAAAFDTQRRHHLAASQHAKLTVAISRDHGYDIWLGAGSMQLAVAMGSLGQADEAIGMLNSLLAAWHAAGAELDRSFFLAGLAQSYRAAGAIGEALRTTLEGIDHAERHQERLHLASLHLLQGELLRTQGEWEAAEAALMQSLRVAQDQGSKVNALRAVLGLQAMDAERGRDGRFDAEQHALQAYLAAGSPDLDMSNPGWALAL
jgi:class 3 adenylate cyclase/tetratricopeptide (TPR) repeat protein